MSTKHDLIRKRKIDQKQQQIKDMWTPQDNSWQRFTKCKLCTARFCCNNYADHKVRVRRLCGLVVCPRCYYMKGSEQLAELYLLGKKLAEHGSPSARRILGELEDRFKRNEERPDRSYQEGSHQSSNVS